MRCAAHGCGNQFQPHPKTRIRQKYCSNKCRQRTWAHAKYQADPVFRQKVKDRDRAVTGLRYALHLLRNRRNSALRRRAARMTAGG